MEPEADDIATTVLDTYDALPAKYKPVKATEDFFQWVPLSGIVAAKSTHEENFEIFFVLFLKRPI